MDAECYSCHAPVAAGLEKPPPSGDRWLRPEDPNRRLPSRSHATVAAGVEKPPPSGDRWLRPVDPNRRLPSRCKAPVAARTLAFRMDRWRERSLKHQRCRPKECSSVKRKVACCSSKLHASHSQTLTCKRRRCQLLHRIVVSHIRGPSGIIVGRGLVHRSRTIQPF
jgi:hypothetical protein